MLFDYKDHIDYDVKEIYIPIAATFVSNWIVGLVGQCIKDNSIVDIAWGLLYIVPNVVILALN